MNILYDDQYRLESDKYSVYFDEKAMIHII